ncbi:MAG TPA: elongation factor P [Firmicutes bacterium]|nr:elongation factor P [Bacillota bacterium]
MADFVSVNDLGPGRNFIDENGDIYTVLDIAHNKTAMAKMKVKLKVKNLRSGVIKELQYFGGDKKALIFLSKKNMTYLYDDGSDVYFMDSETYDQVSIPSERLKWEMNFIKENSQAVITYYENEIIGIELPVKVALKIVQTDDAVRGDTVNNPQKDATLETGYKVKVPMFIKNGEVVVVRTDTGEYDGRA